jgi:hypothetical protein
MENTRKKRYKKISLPLGSLTYIKTQTNEDDKSLLPEENQRIGHDVLEEQKKMALPDAKSKYMIHVSTRWNLYFLILLKIHNLRKVYPSIDGNPPKVAVKGVSFGVKKHTSLGILGIDPIT